MKDEINAVKIDLFLVILTMLFGFGMGVGFGVAEDSMQPYKADGVAAHVNLHDDASIVSLSFDI